MSRCYAMPARMRAQHENGTDAESHEVRAMAERRARVPGRDGEGCEQEERRIDERG